MNKKLATAIIGLTVLGCIGVAQATETPNDGTITFTGTIIKSPCTVKTESKTLSVNFGNVKLSDFGNAAGTNTSKRPITITLDCPSASNSDPANVSIKFQGQPNSVNNSLLAIGSAGTNAGESSEIGIRFFDSADSDKKLDLNTTSKAVVVAQPTTTLTFNAAYESTGADAPTYVGDGGATGSFLVVYQ